jgi:hypothetical protein
MRELMEVVRVPVTVVRMPIEPVRVWHQDSACRGGVWASSRCESTYGDHKSPCRGPENGKNS